MGVSKGTGVLNAQIYNRKYEAKLEFPGGTQTMVQIFYATAQSQINFEKILLKCKPTEAVSGCKIILEQVACNPSTNIHLFSYRFLE